MSAGRFTPSLSHPPRSHEVSSRETPDKQPGWELWRAVKADESTGVLFKKRNFYHPFSIRTQVGPWTGKAARVVNFGCGNAFPPFHSTFKIFWFWFRCCISSERCESRRAAPDRNANSGELRFFLRWLLRLTKHFVLLLSASQWLFEWFLVSSHLGFQGGIRVIGGCRGRGFSGYLANGQVESEWWDCVWREVFQLPRGTGCPGNGKHAEFIFIFRGEIKKKQPWEVFAFTRWSPAETTRETGDLSKSIFHMMCW